MTQEYYIVYGPPIFNIMALYGRISHPKELVTYLCSKDISCITADNYQTYLDFAPSKQKKGMAETLAMECYTLTYIANLIAGCAPNAKIILADGKRRTLAQIIQWQKKKPLAVFMTAMSANFPAAVAATMVLNHANIPVIIGGIHVSTSPDDVPEYIRRHVPRPDLVTQVIGPADFHNISEILTDLSEQRLAEVYRGSKVLENGAWGHDNVVPMPQPKVEKLKKTPLIGNLMVRKFRVNVTTPYIGCPYSCRFCSISTLPKAQRRFSVRSPADFVDELASYQKHGVNAHNRFFFFLPDNLLLGGKKLEEILDLMIFRGLKINFAAQISIDVANNPALLSKLRQAGATHFFIGLETLNIKNLEYINKNIVHDVRKEGLSVAQYYQKRLKRIQDHGISIHGSFIFGLPFDRFNGMDDHTGREIADFCIRNHIGLQPCAFTDLPGSLNHRESQARENYLYGRQGSLDYLVALSLSDLSEPNRIPFDAMRNSPLIVCYMAYQAIQRVGAPANALKNALYSMGKACLHPTRNGGSSLKSRMEDGLWAFASQLSVGLYKDHADMIVYTQNGVKGIFERLYLAEKNASVKEMFTPWIDQFCSPHRSDKGPGRDFECIITPRV